VRHLAVLLALVALAAMAPEAQPPQNPTFRSGADVVRIDVSVLDKNRVPVRGLAAADFIVREEGKPRPVVAAGEIVVPPAPSPPASSQQDWTTDIAPDIGTNQLDQARLFVIVLDDALVFHDPRIAESAKEVGRAVVSRLTPVDRAAVVFTSNAALSQGFTSDRQRLLAAIETFNPRGRQRYFTDWTTPEDSNGAISSAKTLSNVADYRRASFCRRSSSALRPATSTHRAPTRSPHRQPSVPARHPRGCVRSRVSEER
jgi:VWFA-related protein